MIITNRSQISFTKRIINSLKFQGLIPWLFIIFLLCFSISLGFRIETLAIILPTFIYFTALLYWAFRTSKYYIIYIELTRDECIIKSQVFNEVAEFRISRSELFYRTYGRNKYSFKQIQFIENNKTKIKQYAIDHHTMNEIESIEKILKDEGIKKPYGENL